MKNPNILAARIAIAAFYTAPPAFGGALEADAPPAAPDIGAVDGDQPPDWSAIDKLAAGEPPQPEVIPPPPTPTEKAQGIAPTPETPPATPEPTPIPENPEKAPETPAAAPEAPKPTEAAPAKTEEKPGFDAAAAQQKIDALEISPKASSATKEGFANLKAITAAAVGEVNTLKAKLAEAEKRGGMTPELEAEVKRLREFHDTWGAEHDPEIVKPFTERIAKAETDFLEMLVKDPELLLPQAEADKLKAAGFDSPEGRAQLSGILKRLQEYGDPLLYERVREAFLGRGAIVKERDAKIAAIREKQGGYAKHRDEIAENERKEYGNGFNAAMVELVKNIPWLTPKAIAADASQEAKAAAEAHNKYAKEGYVEEVRAKLAASYHRDPKGTAEIIFKAIAHDHVAKERDALKAKQTELEARIEELTRTAAGVRQVAAAAPRAANTPAAPIKDAKSVDLNQSSDQALDAYLESLGKKA